MNKNSAHWQQQFKNVLLAGIGAVVLAEEEVENFIRRTIKEGNLDRRAGEEILREILREKDHFQEKTSDYREEIKEKIRSQLRQLNLPSQQDIWEVNQNMEELIEKLS